MEPITVIEFEDEDAEFAFIRAVNDATVHSLLQLAATPDLAAGSSVVHIRRKRDARVFFLNQPAVDMCSAENIPITVIRHAPAMPAGGSYELEAQYVGK